jgi:hypothetical protein
VAFGVFAFTEETELRKLLVCAALLCVAFVHASGQGSEESKSATPSSVRLGDANAEAARLLKSDENTERAWGAYLAGLHGLKEQTPALVSMLEDEKLNTGYWQESFVRQAALDALIRLDAEVPAEALVPLYKDAPDEVLILLARDPGKNQHALLRLFDEDVPDARWLALNNLLASQRTPGFAARMLGGLKIEANVYVFESEGDHRYGEGGGSGGHGCGVGGSHDESLPPVNYYHLTTEARRGATVLVAGRRNVYYERTPLDTYCDDLWRGLERDHVRVEYVADMLGTTVEELGLDARPVREVVCEDARRCVRALAAVRDDIRRAYSSALARLSERGLLDAAEADGLRPDITFRLNDLREKKSFPLPDRLKGVTLSGYDEEAPEPKAPAVVDDAPTPVVYGPPIIPPR